MSAEDARIMTALPSHPKTKKLIRRLGDAGAWYLVRLFLWAAENRADGDLSGMTAEDIELAVDWPGDAGVFVAALAAVGFLDGKEGARSIHDWSEHNPWVAGFESRSEKARWNAIKRHHGEAEADRLVPGYRRMSDAASTTDSNAASTQPAMLETRCSNAPLPSPSPSPKAEASPSPGGERPPIPFKQIIDAFNSTLTRLPRVRDVTPLRRTKIRLAWQQSPQRQSIEFWQALFDEYADDPFTNGRGPYRNGHENWRPDFDYLLKADVVTKTYEKAMHRMECR